MGALRTGAFGQVQGGDERAQLSNQPAADHGQYVSIPTEWLDDDGQVLTKALGSLTRLNDKNLQKGMESSRQVHEQSGNKQSIVLEQVKASLDQNTSELETQGRTAARLAERL